MYTQSQSYPLDELPICIRSGVAVGYITDGIADLAVGWDHERDRAYVERVESITLAVDEVADRGAPMKCERLAGDHPLFALIEAEIMRRDDAGEIDLNFDNGDSLYIGLRAGAAA